MFGKGHVVLFGSVAVLWAEDDTAVLVLSLR